MNKQDELNQAEAKLTELQSQYAVADEEQQKTIAIEIVEVTQEISTLEIELSQEQNQEVNSPSLFDNEDDVLDYSGLEKEAPINPGGEMIPITEVTAEAETYVVYPPGDMSTHLTVGDLDVPEIVAVEDISRADPYIVHIDEQVEVKGYLISDSSQQLPGMPDKTPFQISLEEDHIDFGHSQIDLSEPENSLSPETELSQEEIKASFIEQEISIQEPEHDIKASEIELPKPEEIPP